MAEHVPFPTLQDVELCVDAIIDHARDAHGIEMTLNDRYFMQTRLMQIGEHAPLLILTLAAQADKAHAGDGNKRRAVRTKETADLRAVVAFSLIGGAIAFGLLQHELVLAITASVVITGSGLIYVLRQWRAKSRHIAEHSISAPAPHRSDRRE